MYNRDFYQPTNTIGVSPEICRQIDEDIVRQITDEVSAKKNQMELHVPEFSDPTNWPIATDYSVAPKAPVRNFEQQLSGRNSSALR